MTFKKAILAWEKRKKKEIHFRFFFFPQNLKNPVNLPLSPPPPSDFFSSSRILSLSLCSNKATMATTLQASPFTTSTRYLRHLGGGSLARFDRISPHLKLFVLSCLDWAKPTSYHRYSLFEQRKIEEKLAAKMAKRVGLNLIWLGRERLGC